MSYDYDVALSFAGEDRKYVEQVADILNAIGLKVFYDKYETVDLWGKNLYPHLRTIYQEKSKYCVIFISHYYSEKVWTNHERESAQARALMEKREYILPARFDKTELPGLLPTISYIDLGQLPAEEFAYLIAQKIEPQTDVNSMLKYLRNWLSDDYEIYVKGTTIIFSCTEEDYYGEFPLRLLLEMYKLNLLEEMFLIPGIVPN